MANGLVLVYTGDGKGKTTAALGLAMRQAGQGGKVLFLQFLKAAGDGGEHLSARKIPGFKIVPCGREGFIVGYPRPEDYQLASQALAKADKALRFGSYQMVVLDEINVAVTLGLIKVAEILQLLKRRGKVHLVLTGRGASPEIITAADIVSEVVETKHDFHTGRTALPGIEY